MPRHDRIPAEEKKRLFALAYAKEPNVQKAAVAAGYKPGRNAEVVGVRLMNDPAVKDMIAKHQIAMSVRTGITAQAVLEELAVNSFSDIGNYLDDNGRVKPVSEWDAKARRAVQSFKIRRTVEMDGDEKIPVEIIELKLWDKNAALNNLAKHFGLLIERQEVLVQHKFDRMPMKDLEAYILEMAPRMLGKPVFTKPQIAKRMIEEDDA